MSKVRTLAVFICVLSVGNAWGAGFMDDFNRANGPVGNGWATQTNGTIKVEIVDNEVLIAGTQATDWVRCGLSRPISDETTVSFDFKADNGFNVHVRIDSAGSSAFVEVYAWPGGPMTHANSPDGGWPGWTEIAGSNMVAGQYNTLMLQQVGTEITITLNGKVVGTVTNAGFTSIESVLISSDAAANATGSLHIDNVLIGEVVAGTAKDPHPANNATDVPRDVVLGWTGAESAVGHDVYLGTVFEDVEGAERADAKGVLAAQGQAESRFDQGSPFEYGQTYYWRIDEVNGAPDNTIIRGDVWSFTVEPFTYRLTNVTATASSAQPGMSAQNTVNGSGLSASDEHSSELTQMWMTNGDKPAWIQFEFDKVYKLHEMSVWNSNQLIETFVGFGAKDVTVEYSTDGATWTKLEGTPPFAQASGSPTYKANTTIAFGALAKFVKLTIDSNWGGVAPQTGLAEVRFLYVPVQAREPVPANGATDVSLDVELNWRPGREATSHKVLFGTDSAAVADGTAAAETVTGHSFTPAAMEFGTEYFWKVDEVGDAGAYAGDVWSFVSQEFALIEDFEAYNDDDYRIYDSWIDGVTTKASGSTVGYLQAPFAERTIIRGGEQSMPLIYDNSAAPFLSEAERTFDSPQNLSANGADTLSLWVQGSMPAFAETASGGILMNAIGNDIWNNADQFRFAYKTLNGDGTMTARVESIAQSDVWAKGGVMIRQSIEPGSVHAFMPITPSGGNGASFQHRLAANGASTNNDNTGAAVQAPYWVKIERKGNAFTGSISPDGTTWTQLGTAQTITMTGPVLIGLAVTSHNPSVTTGAEFSNISTTGNVTGSWQVAGIGVEQPEGNSIEGLYVTVKDSSGKSKTVMNPDASASVRPSWQQWPIPLSEFTSAGVKMNAVKSIVIGVGNKTAPVKGGTGTVFVDDIGFGRPRQ